MTLLRCNEAQVTLKAVFRSSALLGLVSLIFFLTIPHKRGAKTSSKWFADHDITVLDWPANMPDLNLILNLCDIFHMESMGYFVIYGKFSREI